MEEFVKREAVKELFERYGATEDALALVDSIPASDVAPVRHGRWIDNTFCSCCGGFDEDDEGNIIQSFHNYCPACGALMDGKEDAQK